jgi:hypothetical protein
VVAKDQAGNVDATADSRTWTIDTTPPNAPTPNVSPAPNGAGWNNTVPVTVSFANNGDAGSVQSGVASCTPSVVQTAETGAAGTQVGGSCTDNAGNGSAVASVTIKIDTTAPTVQVTGVTPGATYVLGSVPTAACTTIDSLSGVKTNAVASTTGGNANGVGTFTATCSGGLDNAENLRAPVSVTYTVAYNFSGFLAPISNPPTLNSVKAGQAIPVKFSLGGSFGLNVLAAGSPSSGATSCESAGTPVDIVGTETAGGSSLTYDAGTGQYVYTWKTEKAWAGTCRQLIATLNDGTQHVANFQFK